MALTKACVFIVVSTTTEKCCTDHSPKTNWGTHSKCQDLLTMNWMVLIYNILVLRVTVFVRFIMTHSRSGCNAMSAAELRDSLRRLTKAS